MDYLNKKVVHAAWGEGTIQQYDGIHIYVYFPAVDKKTSFRVPSCFEKFLKLVDTDIADELGKELDEQKKQKEQENEEKARRALLAQIEIKRRDNKLGNIFGIDAFIENQKNAIISEILHLKKTGGKRIKIINGVLTDQKKGIYVYSFESDSELNYPDGTQLTLWRGGDGIAATLIGCEELIVYIAVEMYLGTEVPSIEFSAESWRLLDFLIKRLDNIHSDPSPIVQALINDGRDQIQPSQSIATGQKTAQKMACSQPITFIWGPPGTGKTWTLAKIALEHISKKKRVLMLSYSNVSVDGAALRVFEMSTNQTPGTVLRYGYPRDKELLAHPYLSSYNYTIGKHSELLSHRNELLTDLKKHDSKSKIALEISLQLKAIRKRLAEEEVRSVNDAAFVATTVSKAIVDKVLYESKYDVVIFDEASMAYIPQIIFAASLAKTNFICIGDFSQLPPIVQSSNSSMLNMDIFKYCYVTDAVENEVGHSWLCMLDVQRRMHPSIADFASTRMYWNRLRSHPDMLDSRKSIVQAKPFAGQSLVLVDLSGMMSVCTKTRDESRVNVLSALISMGIAVSAAKTHDVGIITPYQAQARLLYALSSDIAAANPNLHKITCATVHQFQGSEKDVIIYDAVDCYRMRYPGILLTSTHNNYANRLFNVALSRAKGKFIAVANVNYLTNKSLSGKMMFRQYIDKFSQDQSAHKMGPATKKAVSNDIIRWFESSEGDDLYFTDLSAAKTEIRIDIPTGTSASASFVHKLVNMLTKAQTKGLLVFIRTTDKSALPSELRKFAVTNGFITDPITIIDNSVTWFGQPASDACFKSERKTLPVAYRPIMRFVGKKFSGALFGFLSMERVMDEGTSTETDEQDEYTHFSSYVASMMKCPECGKPLQLRKSKRPFIGCSGYPGCQYTTLVEPDMLEEYFYHNSVYGKRCPRDGTSLEAGVGKYGLYVCCGAVNRHYYKIEDI